MKKEQHRTIRYFTATVFLSMAFFVFGFLINVQEAEAKYLVEIWSSYPCNNYVYSDGSHVPHPRNTGGAAAIPSSPPPPPDQCRNIKDYQYPVPSGFYKDNWQCYLKTEFYLSCRAVPNPVKPGDTFNFVAFPFYHAGDVDFTWYDGAGAGGSVRNKQKTDGVSSLKSNYSSEGNQRVTIVGVDEAGHRQERICGVTVRADADSVAQEKHGDGVGEATVEFDLEEKLTNNTCTANWKAEKVAQCFIVNTQGTTDAVTTLTGTKEVGPGTWFMRCLSRDLVGGAAYVIQSEDRVCRSNIDVRER